MNSAMNSGLVDGLIANSISGQNSKKRRERQSVLEDAYSNLVSSHNSQEVLPSNGLKAGGQEGLERNPSRIELSSKEQQKLMKLLDQTAAMPYNDIF